MRSSPAIDLPLRMNFTLALTCILIASVAIFDSLIVAQPVITEWATSAECASPSSVFFDEKQNIILATCLDSGIIAIQLPQRTITQLLSDPLDCWWPGTITGDITTQLAFASCQNAGIPPDPNKFASSVMLSGPGYRNVTMFTSFAQCDYVGGFAWDANVSPNSTGLDVYMTCDDGPAIFVKHTGSEHSITPLVNDSISCAASTLALVDGHIYATCGNSSVQPQPPNSLVSLNLQSLELTNLSVSQHEDGFTAIGLTAVPTCDRQSVQIFIAFDEVTYSMAQLDGHNASTTNLTSANQCMNPMSIACKPSGNNCGCEEAFVACSVEGYSIVSADPTNPGMVNTVTTSSQCPNPMWTFWHAPSRCLFAACMTGSVISICGSFGEPSERRMYR